MDINADNDPSVRTTTAALPPTFAITIKGGVRIVSSSALDDMTTYVLLEQDDWFESEMSFVRAFVRPGMHMIDVGANHGVYGLTFASLLNGAGHVWAFEPASNPYAMLASSVGINRFDGVMSTLQYGLSDHAHTAEMFVSDHSELNSLHSKTGRTESIRLDTLDAAVANLCADRTIDFLKLDAEGEEIRIVQGGAGFFATQSPLVMFEVKHGDVVNEGLWTKLMRLGYGLFRLMPGLTVLVPVDPSEKFESFLLNLFAAKPDRALDLASRGLLSFDAGFSNRERPHRDWIEVLRPLPYCQPVMAEWISNMHVQGDLMVAEHAWALNAYLSASDRSRTPGSRAALLRNAVTIWDRLTRHAPGHLSIALCLARASYDLGLRSDAIDTLEHIMFTMQKLETSPFKLPFLPPLADFDGRAIAGKGYGEWLYASLLEAVTLWSGFSSFFSEDAVAAARPLTGNVNVSSQIHRRRLLAALAGGSTLSGPEFDPVIAIRPDNLNGHLFAELRDRSATVPR